MPVRAAPALVISATVHGALIAYVAHLAYGPETHRHVATFALPQLPSPVARPIEVAFLSKEATAATLHTAPRVGPRAGAAVATVPARGAAAITATTGGTEPTTGTEPGRGTGLMRMRGPDLVLNAGTAERIAISRSMPRDELHKSGRLERQPGGRAIVNDRVTTMSIEHDGSVHIEDKKDIDPRFQLPIPKVWKIEEMRKGLGRHLTDWFNDPEAFKRYGRTQDLPRHLQAAMGDCDSWLSTMCEDPLEPKAVQRVREARKKLGRVLGGAMDISAWLQRRYVGDPYSSRKLKLLADTFDERVEMGTAHRAQQQLRSGEYMQRNLDELWAREMNPMARKAALFELWDECDEDEAGLRARSLVIGWIRKHLPEGSPDAYTADELATLQKHRTSRTKFAPYAK